MNAKLPPNKSVVAYRAKARRAAAAPRRRGQKTSPSNASERHVNRSDVAEHMYSNPGFLMASIVFRMDQELRNSILRRLDISYTHFRIMQVLYVAEPRSVGEISRLIVVAPAVLSRVIDQMEGRSLVERRMDETDNRFVNIGLTQRGREIYQEAWTPAQAILVKATATLSAAEKSSLLTILRKLDTAVEP